MDNRSHKFGNAIARSTWALGLAVSSYGQAGNVTWEQQAERLQFVSAGLLDNMPMAEMPMGRDNLMLKANVSRLPKTNPTIGGKSENVPSSPIHAVPTVQADLYRDMAPVVVGGLRLWGGMLPAGSEKLVGVKASMQEKSFGGALIGRLSWAGIEPAFEFGAQRSIATVKGAITAADANDTFHVDTLIGYGALGARIPALSIWGNVLVASRSARSQFVIPADGTNFELNDNAGPLSVQVAGGLDTILGINVGIAQLYIPKRLTMTRMLAGIKFDLGGGAKTK